MEYTVAENEAKKIVIPVEDPTGLSHCEHCGKIVPHDLLRGVRNHGAIWLACSTECADAMRGKNA